MKDITFGIAKRNRYVMPAHEVHMEIEIYYLTEGERMYFVEDRTYHLLPGSVIFISSNRIHKTSAARSQHHERMLLEVHPDFLQFCANAFPTLSFDFLLSHSALVSMPGMPYNRAIRQKLDNIAQLMKDAPFGYEEEIRCEVLTLFLCFQRLVSIEADEHIVYSSKHQKIYEVAEYISNHMSSVASLDELCARFFISKYYLCHSFKEVTGLSVIAFLNATRVRRAQVLLSEEKTSVTRIAQQVGFHSASRFGSIFKRIAGMTPREYRRLMQRKAPQPAGSTVFTSIPDTACPESLLDE